MQPNWMNWMQAMLAGTPEGQWWEKLRARIAEEDGRRPAEVIDREVVCYLADTLSWSEFIDEGGRER